MIHQWMEEEQEQFYKALRDVKKIVDYPIYTEDEMSMLPDGEGSWEEFQGKDGKKMFRRRKLDPNDAPHLSQPEHDHVEVLGVQGTRDGLKEAWGTSAPSLPPSAAKPVAARGAVISDPSSGGPIIEELPDDYEEPPKRATAQRAAPVPSPAVQKPPPQQQLPRSSPLPPARQAAPRADPAPLLPTHDPDEESDEVEDLDEEEEEAASGRYDEDDYYALLGASPTATLQELRSKFRALVIAKHPEKGGDPGEFALLSKAYGVLSDSVQRRQYDERQASAASRRPAPAAGAPAPPQRPPAPAPAPAATAKAAGVPRQRVFVD